MNLKSATLYMSKEEEPKLVGARAVFKETASVDAVQVDIKCADGCLTDYRIRDSKDLTSKQLSNIQREVIDIAERLIGNAATALEKYISNEGQKRKQ